MIPWLKLAPWAACAALVAVVAVLNARVDTLTALNLQKNAQCNARVLNGAANAAQAARIASQAAIEQERQRWQALVTRSEQAAEAADLARRAEAGKVRQIQEALNDAYSKNPGATDWRDTPIPGAVLDSLQQSTPDRIPGEARSSPGDSIQAFTGGLVAIADL